MATTWKEPDPLRRRAGLLSSLSRVYNQAERLMKFGGSREEVEEIRGKTEQRYAAYLESHELTLAEYPEREPTLVTSHDLNDERHELILNNLDAYAEDGSKPEDDLKSLHAASLFSSRSASKKTVSSVKHSSQYSKTSTPNSRRPSTKHSEDNTSQHAPSQGNMDSVSYHSLPPQSKRGSTSQVSQAPSELLSESRVQAELAKKQLEQEQRTQEANKVKIQIERAAAQQKQLLEAQQREAEKLENEAELRRKELAAKRRELEEKQRGVHVSLKMRWNYKEQRIEWRLFKLKLLYANEKKCVKFWVVIMTLRMSETSQSPSAISLKQLTSRLNA